MKNWKIFLLTLLANWPEFASATDPVRTITLRQPIETLIVAGELDIVLTDDTTDTICIEGAPRAVNSIHVSVDGGKVKLSTRLFALTNQKPRIKIAAAQLKCLKIIDNARVVTENGLRIGDLKVIIDADANVRLVIAEGASLHLFRRGNGAFTVSSGLRQMAAAMEGGWQVSSYEATKNTSANFSGFLP